MHCLESGCAQHMFPHVVCQRYVGQTSIECNSLLFLSFSEANAFLHIQNENQAGLRESIRMFCIETTYAQKGNAGVVARTMSFQFRKNHLKCQKYSSSVAGCRPASRHALGKFCRALLLEIWKIQRWRAMHCVSWQKSHSRVSTWLCCLIGKFQLDTKINGSIRNA